MTKNYTYFLVFAFSALIVQGVHAQSKANDGQLTGKVIDEKLNALPFVSVSLLKASDSSAVKGGMTNDEGSYTFKDLPYQDYLVAFNMVGYSRIVKGPYHLTAGQPVSNPGNVRLNPSAKQLKDVSIVSRKPLIERQVDKTVLNIENSALAAGNTALEILQKAPGVTVDKDGNISLRGKKGVLVLIDGKPTYMSSDQLANMLRSTEGNAIQTIELINNPSAKYDAAGNSGIINIKLKKNQNFGTNGSVKAGGGYGRYYKASTGLSLNHREKKFNVFTDANFSKGRQFHNLDIMRVNHTSTDDTYFNQTSASTGDRKNFNYKAGLDYFIDDRNTLGVVVNGYNSSGANLPEVLTLIGSRPLQTDSSVVAVNPKQYRYTGITYNLNYKGTIDTLGQEINADVDVSRYHSYNNETYQNNYLNADGISYKDPYIFRSGSPSAIKVFAFKADYTYPFSKKIKLDAGIKTSVVSTDNDALFENLINNQWQDDAARSNRFVYDENINAGYLNLKKEFSSTTVQVGVRGEQTNSKGNSVTANTLSERHYFDLFPSIFLNQVLSKNHEIGVSYSRRIDRPDYESLNPFISFVDLYTYSVGNPYLSAQYTNAFELTYAYKKTINVSLGYSHSNNVITRTLLSDTLKKTLFISYANLAVKNSYNLNINAPLNIFKWWTTNNNLTFFYNKFSTPDLMGRPFSSGKLAFNANTNHTFTLNSNTSFELSGYYQSSLVEGTLSMKPQYGIDLGASRSFANKRLNLKFAANDVFELQRWRATSALSGQDYSVNEHWESRVFRLTATYRFGNNEIKGARQRSKGSAAEDNRIRSGG